MATDPERAQRREEADPEERVRPIPLFVVLVTLAVVVLSIGYIVTSESFGPAELGDRRTLAALRPPVAKPGAAVDGAQVFNANCVVCHQTTGQGLPGVFPPLDGSEWVVGDARVAANILLHGIEGEIVVKGATYKSVMPSFAQLQDDQLAAVLSYVRGAWSNKAEPVAADVFKIERTARPRTTPFAGGAELKALADAK